MGVLLLNKYKNGRAHAREFSKIPFSTISTTYPSELPQNVTRALQERYQNVTKRYRMLQER